MQFHTGKNNPPAKAPSRPRCLPQPLHNINQIIYQRRTPTLIMISTHRTHTAPHNLIGACDHRRHRRRLSTSRNRVRLALESSDRRCAVALHDPPLDAVVVAAVEKSCDDAGMMTGAQGVVDWGEAMMRIMMLLLLRLRVRRYGARDNAERPERQTRLIDGYSREIADQTLTEIPRGADDLSSVPEGLARRRGFRPLDEGRVDAAGFFFAFDAGEELHVIEGHVEVHEEEFEDEGHFGVFDAGEPEDL